MVKPLMSLSLLLTTVLAIRTITAISFSKRQSGRAQFSPGHAVGVVTSHHIVEASGLAASHVNPGYLYTHNDHGDKPNIYVIFAATGKRKATLQIDGATNHDWEDMSVAPCDEGSQTYCIYIADTGNSGHGARNVIYKVKEPTFITDQHLPVLSELKFSWSEEDCETLLVGPRADVYVVSKGRHGAGVIAQLPRDAWGSGAAFPLPHSMAIVGIVSSHDDPLGGDISPDGREVLIKTQNAVFHWYVDNSTDYVTALQTQGQLVPYVGDPNGEAVCWDREGQGYYTLTEGRDEILYYYRHL